MKRVVFFLLLLVAAPAMAAPIDLYDRTLSFDLPSSFRSMSPAEIQTKYPTQQPPQFGYTDSDTLNVTVVVSRNMNAALTPDKLAAVGEAVQQGIAKRSGVTMHRHGIVSIGGAEWYAVDFGAETANVPVENRLRIGIRQGYVVIFAVNATTSVFPQREAELMRVLESLTLK